MALKNVAKTFNFVVYFDNIRIPFSRVSGIETVMETEMVPEGGVNDKEQNTKKKGKTNNMLRMERALPYASADQKILAGQTIKEIAVWLQNEYGIPYKAFYFRGCTISRVELSDLDASQSDVLMQKVEIKFLTMEEEDEK